MTRSLLEVRNLRIEIEGTTIVQGMDFSVEPGEIVALLGPNGAGKTTIIKSIMGFLPHEGDILMPRGTKLGLVPQAPAVNRTFPIKVYELFFLFLRGFPLFPKRDYYMRVRRTLARVNGENLIGENLMNLSMGELQKVLIALALIQNPDLLFLDEPTSSLDVIAQHMVIDEMVRLTREEKRAIVFVSHDIGVVYNIADKVVCLNKEQKCFGAPKRVLTPRALAETYGPDYAVYFHHHAEHEPHHTH